MKQTGRCLFAFLLLLVCSSSLGAEIGDPVDYMKGFIHGTLIGIDKTPLGAYWTVQLEGVSVPLVAPAEDYKVCDREQDSCTALYFKDTTVKSRTRKIQEALQGSSWFGKSYFLTRTSFLLEFKGYVVPIVVKSVGKDVTELQILGTQEGEEEPCLSLSLNQADRSSNLAALRTRAGTNAEPIACPVPLYRSGSYLLALVDALCLSLGVNETHVIDASQLVSAEGETSLQVLKIFKTGQGWYEQNGYVPDDLQEYRQRVSAMKSYSLQKLREEVDLHQKYLASLSLNFPTSEEIKEVERRGEKRRLLFHRYLDTFWQNHKSENLGEFMQWLLNEEPLAYVKVMERVLRGKTSVGSMVLNLGGDILVKDHRKTKSVTQPQPEVALELLGEVD